MTTTPVPTLAAFALPEPLTIVLPDGKEYPLRPLAMMTERRIEELLPVPDPPLVKDPGKGSTAPKIPDRDDPEYKRAFVETFYHRKVVKIAVGAGLVIEDQRFEESGDQGQWIKQALETIVPRVTLDWLDYASKKLEELAMPECIARAALGNSSPPSNPAAGD